jgi:hypothetical protein
MFLSSRNKPTADDLQFMKHDDSYIPNYIPVSLLHSFNIFEKSVYRRVVHHLNSNDILVNEQLVVHRKDLRLVPTNKVL